jgi:hypothetical protein
MNVTVDRERNRVLVGEMAPEGRRTHALEKHGLTLHWDGSGTLLGIEIKDDGKPIVVVEE